MTGADWGTIAVVVGASIAGLVGWMLGLAWVVREHSLLWLRERDEQIAALERLIVSSGWDYRPTPGLPSSRDPE